MIIKSKQYIDTKKAVVKMPLDFIPPIPPKVRGNLDTQLPSGAIIRSYYFLNAFEGTFVRYAKKEDFPKMQHEIISISEITSVSLINKLKQKPYGFEVRLSVKRIDFKRKG